jgi:hypothetical protein
MKFLVMNNLEFLQQITCSPLEIWDTLIEAAYRQIFFHAFAWDREPALESQLRNGQSTVRDFIRGLLLSKTFRNSFYEKNSNYRLLSNAYNGCWDVMSTANGKKSLGHCSCYQGYCRLRRSTAQ